MSSNAVLLNSLCRFFAVREHADILSIVVGGSSPVSLRLLEWFVAVYDRDIRNDYQTQLRAYTRRMFDPFRRSQRYVLDYEDRVIETTIGQMNFFKWVIENGHWQTAVNNRVSLSAAMARHLAEDSSSEKEHAVTRKAAPLPKAAPSSVVWFD